MAALPLTQGHRKRLARLLPAKSCDTIQPSFFDFRTAMPRRKYAWEKLTNEQLLKQRLGSLRVKIEGPGLEDCVDALNEERKRGTFGCGRTPGCPANGSARRVFPALP